MVVIFLLNSAIYKARTIFDYVFPTLWQKDLKHLTRRLQQNKKKKIDEKNEAKEFSLSPDSI